MKRSNFLIAGLFCVSMLISCGGGSSPDVSSSKKDGTLRIAVVPKGTSNIYWQTVHAGARKAEQELDGVEILWKGPSVETDKEQQISIIQDFIVQNVDGISLAPQDADAMISVVERASRKNIAVVIMDSGVNTEDYISYVATDNFLGGQKAAEEMAKRLNGQGTVVMVMNDPGGASTNEREKGFREKLLSDFPNVKLVDEQYHYNDREKARAVMEDMMTRHTGLNGVFCSNESSSVGALLAVQANQLGDAFTFIGFDSSDDLIKGLESGDMDAIIQQDPFRIGYEGVMTAVKHIRGEAVEKRVDTGVYVVTKDNMNVPEIQALLDPPLEYLQ
jgi:ribose transport system substrate-binding protein